METAAIIFGALFIGQFFPLGLFLGLFFFFLWGGPGAFIGFVFGILIQIYGSRWNR